MLCFRNICINTQHKGDDDDDDDDDGDDDNINEKCRNITWNNSSRRFITMQLCICLIPLIEQLNTCIEGMKNTQQGQEYHTFLHGQCESDR